MDEIIVQTKGITKYFPGVLANDHIDFELKKGEIHTLLGENGAGMETKYIYKVHSMLWQIALG